MRESMVCFARTACSGPSRTTRSYLATRGRRKLKPNWYPGGDLPSQVMAVIEQERVSTGGASGGYCPAPQAPTTPATSAPVNDTFNVEYTDDEWEQVELDE